MMALCLALSLLPTAAFAAEGDEAPVEVQPMEEPLVEETAGPTASGTSFFANGTPITITDSAPDGATKASFDGSFTATGDSAYISWDDHGAKKYVGVSENVTVWGGGDGSGTAVSFPSTSITMTGGTVKKILGGNFGQKNKSRDDCSSVTGDVDISITGGSVTNLIYGGGENNTCVDGTVTITLNNVELGDSCYVNGGVLGHGDEGTRDIENGTMTTYAVVNKVVINATDSSAYVIGGGGSGSTKVLTAYVTLNGCTVDYLYTSGINGEMGYSSLRATNCEITQELAATNRGFVKTAEVTLEDCNVKRLMTGATSGCFSSDSGYPDGSAITDSIVWNIDTETEVEKALLTPMVKRNGDSSNPVYTATTQNTTIKKDGDPLPVSIEEFKPSTKLQTTVTEVIIPEDRTLSLNNVKITVDEKNTLTNVGTIDMDVDSSLTAGENSSFAQIGTVTGAGKENISGAGVKTDYVARVGSTGYDTLQKAIGAAEENDTITLLQNVTLDGTGKVNNEGLLTIDDNKTITIDGQGKYTISGTNITVNGNAGPSLINIQGGAKVTLQNLTLDGGMIQTDYSDGAKHGVNINGAGEVTLRNVDIKNCRWYGVVVNNAKATLDTVTMSNTQWGVNVDKNGSAELVNSNILQDVVYESDDECSLDVKSGSYGTIKVQQTTSEETKGTVSIMGGTVEKVVTAGDNIGSATAEIDISGGTVKGDVTNTSAGKVEITGEETTVNGSVTNSGTGTMVISGGTINGKVSGNRTTISGGKFPNASADDLEGMLDRNAIIITFDANGGTCSEKLRVIRKSNAISTLPTPVRTGYTFDGWYVGNVKVATNSSFTSNTTLTAQWSAKSQGGSSSGSSSTTYSPTLDVSDGGSIKVSPRTPEAGDEVTITPDPDSGYEVDQVTVTDRDGDEIRVTANRDGTYTFTQPRGRVTIEVTFVRETGETTFSDVSETYWAYDEIEWAYDNGYVNGTSASTFAPGASISRQQVWMILARLSGGSPADMAAAREWAMANDISDGTNPGNAVTRQQLAALLFRFAQANGYDSGDRAALTGFPDAGSVASYAVEALQWATASGVINGTSQGALNPAGTATRAQFAVMLYRFWNGL